MTGAQLRDLLVAIMTDLRAQADEFRALDAAVGDGDLGVTVAGTATSVRAMLETVPADITVSDLMRQLARTVSSSNPSTMSALVAAGLLKGARVVGEDPVSVEGAAAAGATIAATIAEKGKSGRGDKTMLDALLPAAEAINESAGSGDGASAIGAAVTAAAAGVEATTPLAGTKGRARWMGDRSAGHPDPGAVLVLRFLEAWQQHAP